MEVSLNWLLRSPVKLIDKASLFCSAQGSDFPCGNRAEKHIHTFSSCPEDLILGFAEEGFSTFRNKLLCGRDSLSHITVLTGVKPNRTLPRVTKSDRF